MDDTAAPITLPSGVTIRAPEDFDTLRKSIYDDAHNALKSAYPMSYNGVRKELHDLHWADPEHYSLAEQKDALLTDKFLARRLRGTMRLYDDKTNDLLDEKKLTLMRVPYLTERGTMIKGSNEYSHVTQSRLQFGAYTRRQNNGDLETMVNAVHGGGPSFRIQFEPSTAQYRLKIKSSKLHLYSLLKDIGVPDEHMEAAWGPEVLARNSDRYDARVFDKAYKNMVPRRLQKADAPTEEKSKAIRDALESTMVHKSAVERTLPAMLGGEKAASWRAEIGQKMAEFSAIPFAPDFSPDETMAMAVESLDMDQFLKTAEYEAEPEFVKAAEAAFAPDLSADEMQNSYNAIYGKVGPRLASMNEWPSHWYTDDSDPLGWISWYRNYGAGTRTEDDERQMRRWKSFKARHGALFKEGPTARRAFALRNWAIDPLKLIEDPEQKEQVRKEMQEYQAKAMKDYIEQTAAPDDLPMDKIASASLPVVEYSANFDVGDPWEEFVKFGAGRENYKGCLMAQFTTPDCRSILDWVSENIPEDKVTGDGWEREIHCTCVFGLSNDVKKETLEEIISETIGKNSIYVALKDIGRFEANEHRDTDCLYINLDSEQLNDLHQAIREKLGDKVRVTYPTWTGHCTLAYVKPGALKSLDGNDYFYGRLLPVKFFIYSVSDRSAKHIIELPK